MLPPRDRPDNPDSPIHPPYPDIVIASGRRTLPYLRALKKAAGDTTFTVFLKDPKAGSSVADLVWVPEHDRLRGENVIVTLTSPHPLTEEELGVARTIGETRFAGFSGKRVGLLIGGLTRGVSWEEETCQRLTERLSQLPIDGHSILAAASRRTPPQLEETVQTALAAHNFYYWNDVDGADNPYRQILALADVLLVTGDSHNMVSEALTTGVPVYVFRPLGLKPKLHQFLDDLQDHKMIRNFTGSVEGFSVQPVDVTGEIADAIDQRLQQRLQRGDF